MASDVSSRTPANRSPERPGDRQRRRYAVILEVHERDDLDAGVPSARRTHGWPSTVLPPNAAISACGTIPIPSDPHHEAWASVDTPIAPAMCAA